MRKIIVGILVVLMVIGTVVAVFINLNNKNENAAKLAQLSERHLQLNIEMRALLEERENYVSLRATETRMGSYIVLFFDNVDENLMDTVYPLLSSYGHKGTIVLCEGLVPGEEGNISKENFDFLLSKGWDTAIGYNSDIDMTASDAPELLGEYLDGYIARLTKAGIEIPFTYCFKKGEYQSRFEPVLTERGFKAIRHEGETGDTFGSAYNEDELYYIGSGVCCSSSTKLQENVDIAYQSELAYGMSVRYVADYAIDTKLDCTTSKYKRMLSYLEEYCPGAVVCTMGELYKYKQDQFTSALGVVSEYNIKIDELDNKIESINKEIEDLVSMLN